jgi:hypothetical protein
VERTSLRIVEEALRAEGHAQRCEVITRTGIFLMIWAQVSPAARLTTFDEVG